eukprot:TRINITY_DN3535_c0_g1_i1.p1 TRINITY_DN3535_c0_g1~~TRINITY_DN3535_c0_g1_i1.p1  ORF type:complete len:239 (-),score=32.23 TRINITY_DN3535_c0_g1_i1:44-760(-)
MIKLITIFTFLALINLSTSSVIKLTNGDTKDFVLLPEDEDGQLQPESFFFFPKIEGNLSLDIMLEIPGPSGAICFSILGPDGLRDTFCEDEEEEGQVLRFGGNYPTLTGEHILNVWCDSGCGGNRKLKASVTASWRNNDTAVLDRDLIGNPGSYSCFSHSCSINCAGDETPKTDCVQYKTSYGSQWLPKCTCSKASTCSYTCFNHSCETSCPAKGNAKCTCKNVKTSYGSQWKPSCTC